VIPFNKHTLVGSEQQYVIDSINNCSISGDGIFTKRCQLWFENRFNCNKTFLTTSCTHALEMCALLLNIQDGDEVIMPSYTFVSTANAFVLRGAKIVFVDIRTDTMNIDETKIESAITKRTKVIVPVHYAGVACEMDTIMQIAKKYNLFVVEDAAQAINSFYKGKALGTIGHLGTISFHETKNYTSAGEGGLLIINDKNFIENAEIIREKGTNRKQFLKGKVDKYSWINVGSSYLLNDVSAAYLWGQLINSEKIDKNRLNRWLLYFNGLKILEQKNFIQLPKIPRDCKHNAHIFYIKVKNLEVKLDLLRYLKEKGVEATFHYVPLHSSVAGMKFGCFSGQDEHTTIESDRLLRLPIYYNINKSDVLYVINTLISYFFNKDKNEFRTK